MAHKMLKNVVLSWCAFNKVDQYGKYGCRIELSKEQAKEFKDWGLKVKKDEDGTLFFRARRAEDRGPVLMKDVNLNVVTENPGNGAIANVILDVYPYKGFGGGIAARIEKVQLIKWEPYGGSMDFDEVVEEGGNKGDDEPDLF